MNATHKYDKPGFIEEIIWDGTLKIREESRATLYEMRKAMGFTGVWNRVRRKAEKAAKEARKGEARNLA